MGSGRSPTCGWFVLAAILFMVVVCTPLAWPAVTGNLQVVVRDQQGEPLAGATVVIESPAQPGQRGATTNERGIARFNLLAPGLYAIRVTMPGHAGIVLDGTRVSTDQTRHVAIVLSGELVEEVNVRAESPLVNTRSVAVGVSLQPELTEAVPVGRTYISRMFMAPGVGTGNNPRSHGGSIRDNLYMIDGINTTDPRSGTWGTQLNHQNIAQQDVVSAGYGPEYGAVVGAVSNVITKSGGNEFSGSLFGLHGDKNWYSNADPDAIVSGRLDSRDYSVNLGGPILEDRLWWFGSYQDYGFEQEYLVDPGYPPRPDLVFDAKRLFGKLTWQVAPGHQLVAQIADNDEIVSNYGSWSINANPDRLIEQDQPQRNSALRYTAALSPTVMLQSQLSFHRQKIDVLPQYPDSGPYVIGIGWPVRLGRYPNEYRSTRNRNEFRADLTWFLSTSHGEHNFKFGVQ